MPPMYSALKRNGVPLHKLARKGLEVHREQRSVSVYKLELLETANIPNFSLEIECSGGFYVRSLIADLARSIDSRAHMTELRRTKHGPFLLNDCIEQNDWSYESLIQHILKCSDKVGISCQI